MWKKFFVALISIGVIGSAGVLSMQLHAESEMTLLVSERKDNVSYIHEKVTFDVQSDQANEKILFIEGGTITGNQMDIPIPLQEKATSFTLEGFEKPGAYQGTIQAQSANLDGSNAQRKEATFSFVIYGKAFEQKQVTLPMHSEKQVLIYGVLPQDIEQPTIVYKSGDESIVSVDENGWIKAQSLGTTKVSVEVYNGTTLLSQDECVVEVTKSSEPEKQEVKAGVDYGYQFIALNDALVENKKNQAIGHIQLGQSGEHTYRFDEAGEANLEVKDNTIFIKKELSKGEYTATLLMTNVKTQITYSLEINYQILEASTETSTPFEFRYDGQAVKNVVRTYQQGNNSFQLSSNQNVSEVTFQLKNEADNAVLAISKTGNVTVKQATPKPVIIEASYHKQTYELPLLIEKDEQLITIAKDHLTLQSDDGEFEPTIRGVQGQGMFIVTIADENILQASTVENGNLVFVPKQVGTTMVRLYHEGDANYKESNVIEVQVSVQANEEVVGNTFVGSSEYLTMPQANAQGWYKESVAIALNEESPATSMLYQNEEVSEITFVENGEFTFPIVFQNEEGIASTPLSMNVKVDTHAPIIAQIEIQESADSVWKEILNNATFQSAYGTGKEINIQASDELLNLQTKSSGVKEIAYRIYSVDQEEEILLEENIVESGETLALSVAYEGAIKVCASAMDTADLQSEEVCQISNENNAVVSIQSENSGMLLRSMAFQGNEKIEVLDTLSDVKINEPSLAKGEVTAAFAFESKDIEALDFSEAPLQVIVPLTNLEAKQKGTWKQKQADGSYQTIASSYKDNACTLSLSSLKPIAFVQEDTNEETPLINTPLRLSSLDAPQTTLQDQVTPLLANRSWQIAEADVKTLWIALAALVIGLFLIIALRSHHMDEDTIE